MKTWLRILSGIAAIVFLASCNSPYAESEDATVNDNDALCAYHVAYIRRTVRSVRETARLINHLYWHPIDGARCDDESCSGGIISRVDSDGVTEIIHMCERFILINGQPFISSIGNTLLPDVTNIMALEAFIGSIYSREMTNSIMTDLTVPSWHWGQFAFPPVSVFIEVDGILFSWERSMGGSIDGGLAPWAQGYIHIENAEIYNDEVLSFSVIVRERSYFLPEDWASLYQANLLRLTFVREEGRLKIDGVEEVLHHYAYRFETFVTFGNYFWAKDLLLGTESAFVFFGNENCNATLGIIDNIIDLSIITGQTIYYFNLNHLTTGYPTTDTILDEFNITAADIPILVYIHEHGFDDITPF